MKRLAFLVMPAFAAAACSTPDVLAPRVAPSDAVASASASDSVPGMYIVLFDDSVRDVTTVSRGLMRQHQLTEHRIFDQAVRGFSVGDATAQAVAALARNPRVRLIEPVRIVHADMTQALPFENGSYQFSGLWDLDRIDELGSPVFNGLYDYPYAGQGTHVYIVDSGVRGGHTQFTGRVGGGAAFIKWSWNPSPTVDQIGHGTAVASVAAGSTYGVAKQATVHSVRIDDGTEGAYCDDIVAGLNWIKANAQRPAVVNLSYGSVPNCFAVRDAIDGLLNVDILVFKSAGNNDLDAWQDRANRAARSVVLGATDQFDWRATFSNWGTTITMFAPGQQVRSAWSGSDVDSMIVSGTSFSSPLAAGVAAITLQHYPTSSIAALKALLTSNATSSVAIPNANSSPNLILFSRIP